MSDNIEGKPVLRRSRTWEKQGQSEIKLEPLGSDGPSPDGTATALKAIGILSLAGGLIGGMQAQDVPPAAIALAVSGVVSAVSLWWMARVLETLLQIRDRLQG